MESRAGDEPAETVELLDGGEQAYPKMLSAIIAAKRSVHLEVYAFSFYGVGANFVDALSLAAQKGVKVHVTIDGWGSIRGGRAVAATLRASGCEVEIYNRFLALLIGRFGRNHRKILLVDDEVAFVGGINIGDENVEHLGRPGWADLALEIRGPQCIALGQTIRREPRRPIVSSLRISLSGLGGGWRMRSHYVRAIAHARRRIHLAHGYFLPDRGIIHAITAAARRGVTVRLLLTGRSDVPFARAASRSIYRKLLAAGVVIHEWQSSVLHAKVATVDGKMLLLGSFNLDPFSLVNLEALVEVTDPKVVDKGEDWIQSRLVLSPQITAVEAGTIWQRYVSDPVGLFVVRMVEAMTRLLSRRKHH